MKKEHNDFYPAYDGPSYDSILILTRVKALRVTGSFAMDRTSSVYAFYRIQIVCVGYEPTLPWISI